ncbi:MAG TPA: DUF5916 domain-containing protein [Mucilaginibacter sp.]|nr:DUF5916 domain-containing protein [Mucilaginibacter sp.]
MTVKRFPFFKIISALLVLSTAAAAQDTINFSPAIPAPHVYAVEATDNIVVDGKLTEASWRAAPVISDFFKMQPRQGGAYRYHTAVRIVFDKKNLYFGVFCKDSVGKKGVRVQDYRRDFTTDNDVFMIQLDPQNLKRFCVSFQTTPLGTQSDLQVFDDQLQDINWDALWKVKTQVTDSGYYAEFAIPFKSLRYARQTTDSVSWNITFSRIARRDNEQTVFPAIPQTYTPYRMTYGAELKDLSLPPPSTNIRVQPYALYQYAQNTGSDGITAHSSKLKAGGDAKWAVNPHAVLDLTLNTDFAQAEVDQAVNNLTRFNVLFPEKRQFFLEDQGVFAGASIDGIKPFFSRSIGLSNTQFNATPVPIDVGLRFTDRTRERTFASLYVHQEGSGDQGAADFGVMRYLKNYGRENNIGVMFTGRADERDPQKGFAGRNNGTLTVDGLIRPSNTLSIQYLTSVSGNNRPDSLGFSNYFKIKYYNNKFFFYYQNEYISKKYDPAMGFIFQNDVIYHQTVEFISLRPKNKKWSWIRELETGFDVNYYQRASDLTFQQADLYIYPVYLILNNGGVFQYALRPNWQNINFDYSLLGVKLAQGRYSYLVHELTYKSDQSKKFSFLGDFNFGNYYNGAMQSAALGLRYAPNPGIAVSVNYTLNRFQHLGQERVDLQTNLYNAEVRAALNPQVQFSAYYQYNSFDRQGQWNGRASWEFAPLSFIYLVYNENNFRDMPVRNQSAITKISFLKQF